MIYNELFANEFDTQILRKKLAKAIGLNEAIVLNQLHYWIEKNKRAGNNFHDGRYWVYNSYEDWQENDFEYWSVDTIKRTFTKLEKMGLVISGNYNKMPMDRTKWYTIDYEKMEDLAQKTISKPVKSTIRAKCTDGTGQIALMHDGNLHRAIPENTTREYSTENTTLNGLHRPEAETSGQNVIQKDIDFEIVKRQIKKEINNLGYGEDKQLIEAITEVFKYYYSKYYLNFGEHHTLLSRNSMQSVIMKYIEGSDIAQDLQYDPDSYKQMIDRHFTKDYGKSIDYSICHFMTEGIRNCLFYEVLY